jgi:DNA-binding NarL/FixJ family response regulator
MNVFIVDDHATFAECLRVVVDTEPEMTCVGTAQRVEQALASIDDVDIDVAVLDVELPDGDGISLAAELHRRRPAVKVIVLTAYNDTDIVRRSLEVDVAGVLSKASSIHTVLDAIRSAATASTDPGNAVPTLFDRHTVDRLVADARAGTASDPATHAGNATDRASSSSTVTAARDDAGLTARELEVLELLSQGVDTKGIADRLYISAHTARGHVKNILTKLEAHSQLEAVVKATRMGLVEVGSPNGKAS